MHVYSWLNPGIKRPADDDDDDYALLVRLDAIIKAHQRMQQEDRPKHHGACITGVTITIAMPVAQPRLSRVPAGGASRLNMSARGTWSNSAPSLRTRSGNLWRSGSVCNLHPLLTHTHPFPTNSAPPQAA